MSDQKDPWIIAWHQTKKLFVAIIGFTLLALGIGMIVLPGPGWPLLVIGFVVLGTEFLWARRWLKKFKEQMPKPIQEELEKKRWRWAFRHDREKK